MLFSGSEHVKVYRIVVKFVAVNVMDNLSWLRSRNLPMLPLASGSLASITKAMSRCLQPLCKSMRFLNAGARWHGLPMGSNRRDHLIPSPAVRPVVPAISFLLVGIKRIAVLPIHLVMPETHFLGYRGAITVTARPANLSTAPLVIRRSVPLHSLVVHKAKSVRCVFPTAAVDLTYFHLPRLNISGKCVNCAGWIGERIAMVNSIMEASHG